jgi:tRNA A-37 threonylcarbamoyl transferase component Bud32
VAAYRQLAGLLPGAEAPPGRVGDYEILEEIGRGGMGVVYRARHVTLHRLVALKMMLGRYFTDPEQRLRFRAEAAAVARLQHPHIVQLFESGEHEAGAGLSRPYFTLELVEGGSLAQRLAGRPAPPRQAAAWLETLARAVHYAHQQGIIHRDLKPSNILLTGDGQPKICDFGVAKLLAGPDLKTLSGMLVGTAEYMAPEQAEGKTASEPATDVYALGAILYEMLTGRPPFKGTSTLDTLNQVRTQEAVPPRRLQPLVPRDLETVCLKCLEKDPRQRYASALALAEDLCCFHQQGKPTRARPVSRLERVRKWARRQPAVAALTLAVLALVLLGTVAAPLVAFREAGLRGDAEARAADAREAEARATQLAESEGKLRRDALYQAYRARIAAAGAALQNHDVADAARQLEATPEDLRGWEWRHLYSRLDDSSAVLATAAPWSAALYTSLEQAAGLPDTPLWRGLKTKPQQGRTERGYRTGARATSEENATLLMDLRSAGPQPRLGIVAAWGRLFDNSSSLTYKFGRLVESPRLAGAGNLARRGFSSLEYNRQPTHSTDEPPGASRCSAARGL